MGFFVRVIHLPYGTLSTTYSKVDSIRLQIWNDQKCASQFLKQRDTLLVQSRAMQLIEITEDDVMRSNYSTEAVHLI